MQFHRLFDAVDDARKTIVVYAPTDAGLDLAERLSARNATVEQRALPLSAPGGFLVVRDDDQFLGALALEDLLSFLSPTEFLPWELDDVDPGYRPVVDLLDDTLFVSLDRRQLLATSREIEDRAWRVGRGTLRVGFQRRAAFEAQRETYRRLAATTDLDVHVYLREDTVPEAFDPGPLTVHTGPAETVGRYWFLLFDGGGNEWQACALIAEETEPGRYRGLWTYDPETVALAAESLS
ncbi:DICT sensory domain-containing protein [Halomicroarcula sp. GCM10025324]|uniref:DICT sensory domain-containing protein n=1 Tax=Haloarcula TaxID=2237 RepID=UPI0023E889FC|nr:DICT sensory domain-containing protein [Halomicroarcula sp. ZS-22-S1]